MTRATGKWTERMLVVRPVRVAICTSEAEYLKLCKWLRCGDAGAWIQPGADATMSTFTSKNGTPSCIVCIRPRGKRTRAAYAALIVHEAVHIWQRIRREIGERDPSPEFEAYSVQNLCQDLFEAVGL